MKTISEIYQEYKIIPSLQEHMLRVAAVAYIICSNFSEPLPKEEIVAACLLHDMGNIIKFKMNVIPEFFEPEGVEYWQNVKDEYIKKYGENEHEANVKIIRELAMPERVVFLANQNSFSRICEHRDGSDMHIKIVHYADGRVNPHGVVSYQARMDEAKKRYKDHKDFMDEEKRARLVNCGLDIEKQIFAKCRIKPEDITDLSVAPIIAELRNFVIK